MVPNLAVRENGTRVLLSTGAVNCLYGQSRFLPASSLVRLRAHQASLPPTNRIGSNQRRAVICRLIAHAERISVGKVFRNIPVVSKRNMRTLSRQADVIAVVSLVAMWEKANSRLFAAANCGKQHDSLPRANTGCAETISERNDPRNNRLG